MSLGQELAPHLPFLRRYARALTGSQAHGDNFVRATLEADLLVIEVTDEGERRPRRRVPAEDGGIGLNLVYLLADRIEIDRGRSCVRCEFDAS